MRRRWSPCRRYCLRSMKKNEMKVEFLGTGTSQGVPVIGCNCQVCRSSDLKNRRLRTSIRIDKGDTSILVDCGPDFRYQALRSGLGRMDAILLTHEHNDHVIGLDDTRPLLFRAARPVPVYGLERVNAQIKERFPYAFSANPYPGSPQFDMINIVAGASLRIGELDVLPVEVCHGELSILGYRFADFAYLTDVKSLPTDTVAALQDLDVVVISALRREAHHSHLSLDEAIDLAGVLRARTTYLTHLSHEIGTYQEVSELLPPNIFLAFDTLQIIL